MTIKYGERVTHLKGAGLEILTLLRDAIKGAEQDNRLAETQEKIHSARRIEAYEALLRDYFNGSEEALRIKREQGE